MKQQFDLVVYFYLEKRAGKDGRRGAHLDMCVDLNAASLLYS